MRDTIKSTDDISSLFKTARKIVTGSFMALAVEGKGNRGPCGRVAFIAGRRLGNAPQRNRAKRLMREAARRAGAPWQGIDVAFVAREQITVATLAMMICDMEKVRQKLMHEATRRATQQSVSGDKGNIHEDTGIHKGNP